jgi:hypothetical protein
MATGFYREFNAIINKAIELILGNQDLLRYMYYTDKSDPLNPTYADVKTSDVLLKNLFPNPKKPTAETEAKCLISMELTSVPNRINTRTRKDYLTFNIMVYIDNSLINGGLRENYILSLMDEIFNDLIIEEMAIGELFPLGAKSDDFAENFFGYQLGYQLMNNGNMDCL